MNKSMKILLVDDDDLSRSMLADYLEGLVGLNITQCDNGKDAFELYKNDYFPLILSDIKMPGMNGLDLLKEINEYSIKKDTKVVLFTGFAELETAVEALRQGAYDYLFKPININRLTELINQRLEEVAWSEPDSELSEAAAPEIRAQAKSQIRLEHGAYLNIGDSSAKVGVFSSAMKEIVDMSAKFHSDRSIPILIEGESGTGKEIIAQLIHHGVQGSNKPLVSINCSAISPSLFESELFGYEGGTFTGAKEKGMKGKFDLAQGGTIFLDEIGDLPLEMQPKLLRVLQEKTFYRVGGLSTIKLDVRIIATTNRKLSTLVEEGKFRQDLYHRINSGRISIPPLREQKEAIAPLAQMFLNEFSENRRKRFRLIHKDAIKILENYPWRGNVRELKNAIERIVLLYDEYELRTQHLNFLDIEDKELFRAGKFILKSGNFILPEEDFDIRKHEMEIVRLTLEKFKGNKHQTARYLGLTPSALRSRLK